MPYWATIMKSLLIESGWMRVDLRRRWLVSPPASSVQTSPAAETASAAVVETGPVEAATAAPASGSQMLMLLLVILGLGRHVLLEASPPGIRPVPGTVLRTGAVAGAVPRYQFCYAFVSFLMSLRL